MKLIDLLTICFATVGMFNTAIFLGKTSYRWTCAIDELLKQRAERKNKKS